MRSWIAAAVVGFGVGFAVPHVARGDGDKKEEKKTECRCEKVACTSDDGMQSATGPCQVRCHEDQAATCECAKCKDDGHVSGQSKCRCNNG